MSKALALAALLSVLFAAPAYAESLGAVRGDVPDGWQLESVDTTVAGMPASVVTLKPADSRVEVLVITLDPMGVDVTGWGLTDLVTESLVDLAVLRGAPEEKLRVRRADCVFAESTVEGRSIVFPGPKTEKNFVVGLGWLAVRVLYPVDRGA